MGAIGIGRVALPLPGVEFESGPVAVVFYKVTCPVCQMAAPKIGQLRSAYEGRVVGVGQDPLHELEAFARQFGMAVRTIPDLPPYEISDAYGIDVVPTVVLVGGDGVVVDTVVSWDREGYNRVSARLAKLAGVQPLVVSTEQDGLPALRPG
jgi:thiol-disulfide isomerase/thioredoxin